MTISVRLDDETAAALEALAVRSGRSKSQLIRESLIEYLGKQKPAPDAWELGKDLFGRFGSGRTDLAEKSEEILREMFREKHRGSRRRA